LAALLLLSVKLLITNLTGGVFPLLSWGQDRGATPTTLAGQGGCRKQRHHHTSYKWRNLIVQLGSFSFSTSTYPPLLSSPSHAIWWPVAPSGPVPVRASNQHSCLVWNWTRTGPLASQLPRNQSAPGCWPNTC